MNDTVLQVTIKDLYSFGSYIVVTNILCWFGFIGLGCVFVSVHDFIKRLFKYFKNRIKSKKV